MNKRFFINKELFLNSFKNQIFVNLGQFFQFPKSVLDFELAKFIWMIRLRWMAFVLFLFISIPAFYLGIVNSQNFKYYLLILFFLFIFNFINQAFLNKYKMMIQKNNEIQNIKPLVICFQLGLDLILLTFILFLTEGLVNPFLGLFLLHSALGGLLIRGKYSWPYLILTHALMIALQLQYINNHRNEIDLHITIYLWVTHLLIFITWFVMRSLGYYIESLLQSRLWLEKQDRLRALGALAAGFSHEFASPLNAAKLRIDRIKRLTLDQTQFESIQEDVNEAQLCIADCESVIHSMNTSQLDVRDHRLKFIDIENFLNEVIESWKETFPKADVVLQIDTKLAIQVSPINFAQVILNLLDNAYYAASFKKIIVHWEIKNQQVIFSIEDQGSGFCEEVLSRQGEPFVTTKKSGTGLGLYVSELFVQSMGGNLKIQNRPTGAKVILSWPVSVENSISKSGKNE